MIRYFFNKMLLSLKARYDYDVRYMQDILNSSLSAFLKLMGFQTMASHRGNLPPEPLYAARLRAIIWDDCGPCTQLVVKRALEQKVDPETVRAIIDRNLDELPEQIALVVRFTECVLVHNPEAEGLREKIVALWGQEGAYCISSYRVYPALKYALGYGKACSQIMVGEDSLAPTRYGPLVNGGRA